MSSSINGGFFVSYVRPTKTQIRRTKSRDTSVSGPEAYQQTQNRWRPDIPPDGWRDHKNVLQLSGQMCMSSALFSNLSPIDCAVLSVNA